MFYHRFWSVSEFIRVWCFNGNLIYLLDAFFLVKRLLCVIYRFVLDLTSPIFLSSPIRCWQDLIPSVHQARRGLRSGQASYIWMFMKKPKRFLKAKCHKFEVHHGNEDTYREVLWIKKSFASYSQVCSPVSYSQVILLVSTVFSSEATVCCQFGGSICCTFSSCKLNDLTVFYIFGSDLFHSAVEHDAKIQDGRYGGDKRRAEETRFHRRLNSSSCPQYLPQLHQKMVEGNSGLWTQESA